MSAFALLIPPANFTIHLQRLTERSSTMRVFPYNHSFILERSKFNLYRTIQRSEVLGCRLLSQPPTSVWSGYK
jgi:hypothetical protein